MVVVSVEIDLVFDHRDGELHGLKIQGIARADYVEPHACPLLSHAMCSSLLMQSLVPAHQLFINGIIAVGYQQNCRGMRTYWLALKKTLTFGLKSELDVFCSTVKILTSSGLI